MTRILAIADEVDEALFGERVAALEPDVVVACGDLPFDYLEYIVTMTNVPLVFVRATTIPTCATSRAPSTPRTSSGPLV